MKVVHGDLDNTLIYSCRHDIGEEKVCVELYEGREVSFMTKRSLSLLKEVQKKALFVPVTTRTAEQYRRIDFRLMRRTMRLYATEGFFCRQEKRWQNGMRNLCG